MKKLNLFQLKWIGAVLMTLGIVSPLAPEDWRLPLNLLGQFAAPIFSFAAVEGVIHTRNLLTYNARFFQWGLLMALGNGVLAWLFPEAQPLFNHNYFFSLGLAVLVLNLLMLADRQRTDARFTMSVGAALIFAVGATFADNGFLLIGFAAVTYLCYNKPMTRRSLYFALIGFGLFFSIRIGSSFLESVRLTLWDADYLFFGAFPLLLMYNGEYGPKPTKRRWAFYCLYPLVTWGAVLVAAFLR